MSTTHGFFEGSLDETVEHLLLDSSDFLVVQRLLRQLRFGQVAKPVRVSDCGIDEQVL